MKDDNCIFCKLANKDIPTNIIYEDEKFTVILDASPATKGHALILPKNHAANIYELPDEDAADIFVLAKKLATKMTEILHCDGFNIVQNNGEVADAVLVDKILKAGVQAVVEVGRKIGGTTSAEFCLD